MSAATQERIESAAEASQSKTEAYDEARRYEIALREQCLRDGMTHSAYSEAAQAAGVAPELVISRHVYRHHGNSMKIRGEALGDPQAAQERAEQLATAAAAQADPLPLAETVEIPPAFEGLPFADIPTFEELNEGDREAIAAAQSTRTGRSKAAAEPAIFGSEGGALTISEATGQQIQTLNIGTQVAQQIIDSIPLKSDDEIIQILQRMEDFEESRWKIIGAAGWEAAKRMAKRRGEGAAAQDYEGYYRTLAAKTNLDVKTIRDNVALWRHFFADRDTTHADSGLIRKEMYRAALPLIERNEDGSYDTAKAWAALDMAERKMTSQGEGKYTVKQFREEVKAIRTEDVSAVAIDAGERDDTVFITFGIDEATNLLLERLVRRYMRENPNAAIKIAASTVISQLITEAAEASEDEDEE